MKMKKFIAVLSVVGMVAAMAAGCGGNSDSKSSADASGSASDWDSSTDITIVSREDGSGTRGAFIELFGVEEKNDAGEKVDMTTEDAQITNSTSVMLTTVAGDEYAIGYVSLGSLDDSVKAVKIDGAEATADNIKSGDYKVSRPFNVATKKGQDNEVAKDFLNFILSKEGQDVVSEEGYIAQDDAQAFSLMPETSLKEYQQAIETAMAEHTNYDFLFLADIPGGTPYNLSACYTQTHSVEALCGLSMNLLIDVLELRKKFPCCQIPQELLSRQSTQKNYIIDLKKMLES